MLIVSLSDTQRGNSGARTSRLGEQKFQNSKLLTRAYSQEHYDIGALDICRPNVSAYGFVRPHYRGGWRGGRLRLILTWPISDLGQYSISPNGCP